MAVCCSSALSPPVDPAPPAIDVAWRRLDRDHGVQRVEWRAFADAAGGSAGLLLIPNPARSDDPLPRLALAPDLPPAAQLAALGYAWHQLDEHRGLMRSTPEGVRYVQISRELMPAASAQPAAQYRRHGVW